MSRDLKQVWGIRFGAPIEDLRRRFSGLPEKVRTQGKHTYYTFGSDAQPVDDLVRWITVAASEQHGAYKITAAFKPGPSLLEQAVHRLDAEYGPPQGGSLETGPEWFDAAHRIAAAGDENAAFVDGFLIAIWAPSLAEWFAEDAEGQKVLEVLERGKRAIEDLQAALEEEEEDDEPPDLHIDMRTSDRIGIVAIFEDFFIGKIEQGLQESGQTLTKLERDALKTPVRPDSLMKRGMQLDLQALQGKCEQALTTAYARDTSGPGKSKEARDWRHNNEHLRQLSERVISGVVQNWYLKVGRAQEKQATGCFAMALLLVSAMTGIVGLVFL